MKRARVLITALLVCSGALLTSIAPANAIDILRPSEVNTVWVSNSPSTARNATDWTPDTAWQSLRRTDGGKNWIAIGTGSPSSSVHTTGSPGIKHILISTPQKDVCGLGATNAKNFQVFTASSPLGVRVLYPKAKIFGKLQEFPAGGLPFKFYTVSVELANSVKPKFIGVQCASPNYPLATYEVAFDSGTSGAPETINVPQDVYFAEMMYVLNRRK